MNSQFLTFALVTLVISAYAHAGTESMKEMPLIQPKTTVTVSSKEAGEDLNDQRGFGDREPSVRMMNLMMVEGSGAEGMDMSNMKSMPDSDRGNGMHIAQNDQKAEGHESLQPKTSDFEYSADVKPNPPKVGANTITISLKSTKTGKPAAGLKPKAQVSMMSMDMGTDEPRVREVGPGMYQFKATFSMKGPWAVKLVTGEEEKVFPFDVVGK